MIEGKTKSGFEFKLEEDTLDDWELFEDLTAVEEGESTKIIGCAKRILGNEQYNRLKEFLRDENGKISTTAMSNAISEIFGSTEEGKN